MPLDAWTAQGEDLRRPPWDGFHRVDRLFSQGDVAEAAEIWWQIAFTEGFESLQYLQAWHFLRAAGRLPSADKAKLVLGVVIEMPNGGRHDLLAAYSDGSARYVNHSDKVILVEDRSDPQIQGAIQVWIDLAHTVAEVIGPWNTTLPNLPPEHACITILTPIGPHFGQGPERNLSADPMAGSFIAAATIVLRIIVDRAIR